jgi:amino acid permease
MEVTPRRTFLFLGAMVVGTGVLAVAVEAAGKGVALAVATAAIAAMVLSYVSMIVILVRGYADGDTTGEHATERVRRRSFIHMLVAFTMPYVVVAAHPWGIASIAVGFGVLVACQAVLLHVTIILQVLDGRRRRRARSS